ncbi:MAG: phosphotransferase [Rhodovarius sp.]|nr:phosphotransferase [Rhodovarius sp.]
MTAEEFLSTHGYGAARRLPLPGDASARRYERLEGGPEPALLMLAPPPEDPQPFIRIARHMAAHGLTVPRILAEAPGMLIVQDLGPCTMAEALDRGADPLPLYLAAAEALARWHAVPPPAGLPRWGVEEMTQAAAATFLEWWWPAAFGTPPEGAIRAAFTEAMAEMLTPFAEAGTLVHRDFFPANLIPAAGRIGIIDFQDAALGHPAYDLVSLIEDARRAVPEAIRRAVLTRYAEARGLSADDLAPALAAFGAQRHLRVAALWVRLARRDGKPAYLRHGPRCWALLEGALAHPAAAPLRRFLDRYVPPGLRGNPA